MELPKRVLDQFSAPVLGTVVMAAKVDQSPAQRSSLEPADILTPKELAKRLKVPVSWVYKHTDNSRSNENRLPVVRLDGHLRFVWSDVVNWMRTRGR